jgi:hypothetical protein
MNIEKLVTVIVFLEEKLALRRSGILILSGYMVYHSYIWSTQFAEAWLAKSISGNAGVDALGLSAIISAVNVPAAWLMRVVFTDYLGSKGQQQAASISTSSSVVTNKSEIHQ